MTDITTFEFHPEDDESIEIRSQIDENGDPWFVAKDICDALGYAQARDAVRDHVDEDDKGTVKIGQKGAGFGGAQNQVTVSESGLYALIFGSKKPEAKKFKKWVTKEVLPSIRKKGGYISPHATLTQRQQLLNEISLDLEVMELAKNVASPDWYNAQMARIMNRGLSDDTKMPLTGPKLRVTCREFLLSKGLSLTQAKRVGAVFGGRVTDYYFERYPGSQRAPQAEGDINASYEEKDWDLFERAWGDYYLEYFAPMGF